MYQIDLRGNWLVTLSGCETARSDVAAGDEPVGIGMAFLHTGARALLASLWKVEDRSTARLMEKFYSEWLGDDHPTRVRALREAKLDLIQNYPDEGPRHWASFVLIGPR